jgi:SAM-dependent methyltransferase/nucleoside phosphorylase
MNRENVVEFGNDIAFLYDKTRPFPQWRVPPTGSAEARAAFITKQAVEPNDDEARLIELFAPVIRRLVIGVANVRCAEDKLRVLDAGCGTGRVALPFYHVYRALRSQPENQGWPELQIDGVDISFDMLRQFRRKLHAFGIHDRSAPFQLYLHDLRELGGALANHLPYDLLIVQWLFHTVLDWRTAALQLDRLAHEHTLLMTLCERTSYYRGLDGDIADEKDTPEGRIWENFHKYRRDAVSAHAMLNVPPSMRLGAGVSDKRITSMFRALGWQAVSQCDDGRMSRITVDQRFDVREFIKCVVRERAFTNMRIGAPEETLQSVYGHVANKLTGDLYSPFWRARNQLCFSGTISANVVEKLKTDSLAPRIILDAIEDTVGVTHLHAALSHFDRKGLWLKLFGAVWDSLCKVGFGDANLRTKLKFFIVMPPYQDEPVSYFSDGGPGVEIEEKLGRIWEEVTRDIETADIVHLAAEPKAPVPPDARLIPQISTAEFGSTIWTALQEHGEKCLSQRWTGARGLGCAEDVLRVLRDVGLVEASSSLDVHRDSLGALSELIAIGNRAHSENIYLFPSVDFMNEGVGSKADGQYDRGMATKSAYGFIVGSSAPLDWEELSQVWGLFDYLVLDFLEFGGLGQAKVHQLTTKDEGPRGVDDLDAEVTGWPATYQRVLSTKPDDKESSSIWGKLDHDLAPIGDYKGPRCEVLLLSVRRNEKKQPGRAVSMSAHRESRGLAYSIGCNNPVGHYDLMTPVVWWKRDDINKSPVILHRTIEQGFVNGGEKADLKKVIEQWKPKIVVLAGVAGGSIPAENQFCDVVIAEDIYNTTQGTLTDGRMQINEEAKAEYPFDLLMPWVKGKVAAWNTTVYFERPGVNRAFVSSWGSSLTYQDDPENLYSIANQCLGMRAYELEAANFSQFMKEVNVAIKRPVPWLVLKGICDFAEKHNWYQTHAAARAGEFLGYLYSEGLIKVVDMHYHP